MDGTSVLSWIVLIVLVAIGIGKVRRWFGGKDWIRKAARNAINGPPPFDK